MEQPVVFQRVEAVAIFGAALAGYLWLGYAGWVFAVCLLLFDLSMVGYLFGPRIGAFGYNLGHSLLLPVGVLMYALHWSHASLLAFALLWVAHIGFDRALGYGLKFREGFTHTHLGKIGRQ